MKRTFKYLAFIIGIFLILIVGILMFTQTELFREILRKKTLQTANSYFNGKLYIEQIKGNLYNTINLKNIALSEGDSTVVHIDSIYLKYHLKSISNKHIVIDTILIQSPQFNLWFKDSATFHLMYVLDKVIQENETTSPESPLNLNINHMHITDGKGRLQTKYLSPSIQFSNINIKASGVFKDEYLDVNIKQIELGADKPKLNLRNSHVILKKQGPHITLNSLLLQSDKSLIEGKGHYTAKDNFSVIINAKPLDDTEIKNFISSIPIKTIPELRFNAKSQKDEFHCDILFGNDKKHIGLKGTIHGLPQALEYENKKANYNIKMYVNNFIPEDWFEINKTNAYLNGTLTISGNNIFNHKDDLKLNVNLSKSAYKGIITDTLKIDAIQKNNIINANIRVAYNESYSKGHFQIKDLYNKQIYTAGFETNNLDIGAIEPSITNTVVNGNVLISGTHILSDKHHFIARAALHNSKIYDFDIDTVSIFSDLQGAHLKIDTLSVITQDNRALAQGSFDLISKSFSSQLTINSTTPRVLKDFGIPELNYENTTLKIIFDGTTEAFNYKGDVNITNLDFNTLKGDTIHAVIDGFYSQDSTISDGTINIRNLSSEIQNIDTIGINYSFHNMNLRTEFTVNDDSIDANLAASIEFQDTIDIQINKGHILTPYVNYYLTDTIQQIKLADRSAIINNIEIKDHNNSDFIFKAQGILSTIQSEYFNLLVRDFDLYRLNHFIDIPDSIGGLFSTKLSLHGKPDSLMANCNYTIFNPFYGKLKIPDINGELNYRDKNLKLDTWLPQLDSAIYADFSIPIAINVNPEMKLSYHLSDTFNAQLFIDTLNIKTPNIPAYEHIQAGVDCSGYINAFGTFEKPLFNGSININNGYITNQNHGIYYKNATGQILLKENTINIDTVFIQANKGYLAAKGHITFDSTIISGKISNSAFNTDINRFYVSQHKNHDINISGTPYISSDHGNPLFGGKLTVNNSSFFIPGLLKTDETKSKEENIPILIAAINEADTSIHIKETKQENIQSPIMKHLQGRLNIDIPRSTWLKGNDMNIEISGNFDIAKNNEYFELFGDIEIIRGNYILYGRKFNILEGIITFTGGEQPDPKLEIKANYIFRGSDKEKHTLELSITEYLSEPVINFTLNDTPISQSDAVSIMVFGKTMDELSYDGQNGIIGSVGSNMLANVVTSSLSSTLGQRFKLDMIEINSTKNWQSAAFVVGKYITNDLFVIYQRGFGETEDDEITPETITLEYELNKLLFFRLQSGSSRTSGFDVILKFESKK